DSVFGPDDAVMTGAASPGSNVVTWDGFDGSGAVVPALSDPYEVRIWLGLGEFHFTAVDVETANAGIAIRQFDPLTAVDDSTLMYWDDTAVLSNGTDNPPDPAVTLPDGVLSDVNAHTWGDFSSDGSVGIGNDAYFDTWVFGQEVITTV